MGVGQDLESGGEGHISRTKTFFGTMRYNLSEKRIKGNIPLY